MQSNPIVVGGVLYATTPTLKVVAVDAATGRELWKFDPSGGAAPGARFRHRGVVVHGDRVFVTYRNWLYALSTKDGQPIATFGTNGRVDLREGLGRPADKLTVTASTPGVVFEDLLIMGSTVPETLPSAPGDIRAFDVNTGKIRWCVPHDPASGRAGLRDLAAGRLADRRRRERVVGRHGRSNARRWCSRRRDPRRSTSTARTARATTCTPTASSRSTRGPGSTSGTSRRCSTTCGTWIFRPRRTWSR